MLRFRQGEAASASTSVQDAEDSNHDNEVKVIKDKLLFNLGLYESVIFYFQQLLVWEKPIHSAVFVLMLHAGFWYLKVWSTHALGLLASVLLLVVWLDMWKHKIWPEIRAEAPDPEADEWGELHPRLLSLPEICLILAEFCVTVQSYVAIVWKFRSDNPGKFTAAATAACVFTIIVGRSIPGTLIAYIIMVCCLMWPLLWYRRWIERAYSQMEPFLMQLQYSLKPRMKRNGKKASHITKEIDGTSVEVHTDSSSDDEDISEFVKPLDAVTTEVLARALTDDDELSESDESLLAHELPSFSHPSSLDGDRGSHTMAEVVLPTNLPAYEDPNFARDMLDAESSDEDLGVPMREDPAQQMPGLAQQIIANATAEAMTTAVKNAFSGALEKINIASDESARKPSTSRQSSEEDFVVLHEKDIHE